jgi:hypothetical protein
MSRAAHAVLLHLFDQCGPPHAKHIGRRATTPSCISNAWRISRFQI